MKRRRARGAEDVISEIDVEGDLNRDVCGLRWSGGCRVRLGTSGDGAGARGAEGLGRCSVGHVGC